MHHRKFNFSILVQIAPYSTFPVSWPGGMRGAIESAALAVGMARRVEPKPKVQIANLNLQITNPPHISPQRTCAFRPADPSGAQSPVL